MNDPSYYNNQNIIDHNNYNQNNMNNIISPGSKNSKNKIFIS